MATSAKATIPATVDSLCTLLDARPVLWLGSRASMAAGYPSSADLAVTLRERADADIPADLSLPEVADRFVHANSAGTLHDLLHECVGRVHNPPTDLHHAVARLAGRGRLAAIITTNVDRLIERALEHASVSHIPQSIETQLHIAPDDLRVIKLHGSMEDWQTVLISGTAQRAFDSAYRQLSAQLDVLLQQRPVLFVGCSMTHARILDWLHACAQRDMADLLKRWRCMLTLDDWNRALASPWQSGTAADVLGHGNVRPLIVEPAVPGQPALHCETGLWTTAADRLAPTPVDQPSGESDDEPSANLSEPAVEPGADGEPKPKRSPTRSRARRALVFAVVLVVLIAGSWIWLSLVGGSSVSSDVVDAGVPTSDASPDAGSIFDASETPLVDSSPDVPSDASFSASSHVSGPEASRRRPPGPKSVIRSPIDAAPADAAPADAPLPPPAALHWTVTKVTARPTTRVLTLSGAPVVRHTVLSLVRPADARPIIRPPTCRVSSGVGTIQCMVIDPARTTVIEGDVFEVRWP